MFQLTCIPTQITKGDSTFVVLRAITGKVPAKPFLSMKQVNNLNLPLNVPTRILWDYATISGDKGDVTIVDVTAHQVLDTWDFGELKVEEIATPEAALPILK